ELHPAPQGVPNSGRLRIETDIPREIDVARFDQRLDVYVRREQMRDPFLDRFAERVEPASAGREVERHVEEIAAVPGRIGVGLVEHVDLAGSRQAEHGDERRDGLRIAPETFSSSAATSDPSCTFRRCGRKNSSAARSMNTSSQLSKMLRRMTCTS